MVVWPTDDHDKSGMWICKNTRTTKGLTVQMIYMSRVVANAVAAEQAEFVAEQAEYAVPAAPASPASLDS